VRAALAVLLVGTAVLYLWQLSASGYANSFYAAAVQAGTKSWKAFFFGSIDSSNFITVDKPPASLWVMSLSARLFGVNAWSILVPQALMGVATVALLYASVRRTALAAGLSDRLGTNAALLAGAALAVTPVAVLIFRFNNPDALLTLLLVGATYATLRAVERGGTRWLLLAATLVGFGFLAKMLQAFLVLPALASVWLLAAPVGWGRRLRDLVLATAALVVSAGWWLLVVALWPAADRPFIGGSQTNSAWELVFGYNGFGRLTGNEVGSVGGGAGGGWGQTGLTRLFGSEFGGQIAWLLPAALIALGALLWWTRRAPRTDALRAATLAWGAWLVVTGLTLA
jgi:4-amino-4-deoxy-L-arabinose transferase-like glycosyltransferase